ncbi:MAG: hypothetical protein KTR31_35130 [Myxococcales bacterium]|nr:hypothetical protein [Myxococcales bacterium]
MVYSLLLAVACKPPVSPTPTELSSLTEGQAVAGFRVVALYVDDGDRPLGVRLTHEHTRFDLALFQLETAPQSYLWVNTVADSDRGEPHTQEHLLLGKGNTGRAVATLEDMALVGSSAFTAQTRTVYHFHTTASSDVYFDVLGARLDALLHPDYTDLEIEREVHHYGVRTDAETGQLALEEKGTVYNEMDSSYQRPWGNLWRRVGQDLYGTEHPLAVETGGLPSAIRTMTAEHIRDFHAATHHLANMGMIAVLPTSVPLPTALQRFDATLRTQQPEPTEPERRFVTDADLPQPQPTDDRARREIAFPNGDAAGTANVMLAWPPTRELSNADQALLQIFLSGLAGSANTNLYEALVDRESRERDTGATSVSAWVSDDLGHPVHFSVGGLPNGSLTDDDVTWLADRIRQELARVAALEAGDPELEDLTRRLESEVVEWRRWMRKTVSSPPRFGFRGTGTTWYDLVMDLDTDGGFRRSLTYSPHLAYVEREVGAEGNPWTERLAQWGLLDAEPLVYVNRPSPEALQALSDDKAARLQAEVEALVARYGTDDEQAALAAFAKDYDAATAALEAQQEQPDISFVDDPPLTRDEALDYSRSEVLGVPLVASRFSSMTGAQVGLYLDVADLHPDHERLLPALGRLLRSVGVIVDGQPVPHTEVIERLQREVLSVSAGLATHAETGRIELSMTASGTDADEVSAALGWAATFLSSPDWRPENLPRIRDVVDAQLSGLRNRMRGSEESWVRNPASAWEHENQPAQLRAWSFLTQTHDVLRLKWRLADPGPGSDALRALASAGERLDREGLTELAAVLQDREGEPPLAANRFVGVASGLKGADLEAFRDAVADLERSLADLPDDAIAADWDYLCHRLAADWDEAPADVLAQLEALRSSIAVRPAARLVAAGGAVLDGIDADLGALLGILGTAERARANVPQRSVVRGRLAGRGADAKPVHVGLFDPNRRSGVHVHSAALTRLTDTDESSVLDYLATQTYGGGGSHGVFMRTWGAGLAYSNGVGGSSTNGRVTYYAERCPELPQTLTFVVDVLDDGPVDDAIAEYAVAGAFSSRMASAYESRAWAMASDLQDGQPPEVVRAFREAVLAQRGRPDLAQQLRDRMSATYGRVLPGLGPATAEDPTAISFVVGDDAQLGAWAAYLAKAESGATLQRLYPRDFWIVEPIAP